MDDEIPLKPRRGRPPKPKTASRFVRSPRDGAKRKRVNKPGQGRPQSYFPTPKDRENVERLAGMLSPHDEIAAFLDIAKDTLERHYPRELHRGRLLGKLRSRRTMQSLVLGAPAEYDANGNLLREEVKPDPAMVRFFARTKLGYVEEYKIKTAQTVPDFTGYDWSKLSDDELAAAERILAKAIGEAPGGQGQGRPSEPAGERAVTRH